MFRLAGIRLIGPPSLLARVRSRQCPPRGGSHLAGSSRRHGMWAPEPRLAPRAAAEGVAVPGSVVPYLGFLLDTTPLRITGGNNRRTRARPSPPCRHCLPTDWIRTSPPTRVPVPRVCLAAAHPPLTCGRCRGFFVRGGAAGRGTAQER